MSVLLSRARASEVPGRRILGNGLARPARSPHSAMAPLISKHVVQSRTGVLTDDVQASIRTHSSRADAQHVRAHEILAETGPFSVNGLVRPAAVPGLCLFASRLLDPVRIVSSSCASDLRPVARDPVDRRSPESSEASGRRSAGLAAGRTCGRAPARPEPCGVRPPPYAA